MLYIDYDSLSREELLELLKELDGFLGQDNLKDIPKNRRFYANTKQSEIVAYRDDEGFYVIEEATIAGKDIVVNRIPAKEFEEKYKFSDAVPINDYIVREKKSA